MYFTILEGVDIKVLQIEEIKFELQDYKNKLEEMRVSLWHCQQKQWNRRTWTKDNRTWFLEWPSKISGYFARVKDIKKSVGKIQQDFF